MPRLVKYYNLFNLARFLRELQIWTILYHPLKEPDSHEGCPTKIVFWRLVLCLTVMWPRSIKIVVG